MYGFQKLTGEGKRDRGAYFHELFLRGRVGLAKGIQRQKYTSLLDSKNEPNLHMFPPMPQNFIGTHNANMINHATENMVPSDNVPRTVQYLPSNFHMFPSMPQNSLVFNNVNVPNFAAGNMLQNGNVPRSIQCLQPNLQISPPMPQHSLISNNTNETNHNAK